jgi:hypothetical protein
VTDSRNWLRFGANAPHQIFVFEPLFEEYNRTRRLLVEVARALERAGIGLVFPNLGGMGESEQSLENLRLADWRADAAAAIAEVQPTVIASLRGGALIDTAGHAKGWWRLAPETGTRIVRDLKRVQLTSGGHTLYAGHRLSQGMLADLEAAIPAETAPLRTLRLESDAAAADAQLPGSPLWRRAEPGEDPALAAAIAADLAAWTRHCAVS